MKCPYCGCIETKVLDSRPNDDKTAIRRRRECEVCHKRFTTYEKIETIPLMVVKKNGTTESYNRQKIENGIIQACYKRHVTSQTIEKALDEIENTIFSMGVSEIDSSTIGEIVMDKIKAVDPVAYVRFASVYRQFKDVNTFIDELRTFIDIDDKQ
ncbi:MAG: transcriptional repressor NrdR [Parasporobacterium sp.]|nr:transcriptional repressor NrdR [Parasporobacterium sp.]